jgi:group II intron reverse transcriptase/maturase
MSLATPSRIRQLQRRLYRKSKAEPDFRFYTLWDKVCRMDVLREAWRRVKANDGASGVDRMSIQAVEKAGVDEFLVALQTELTAKTYQPMPVRRVWIPKRDGKMRPLGIPVVRDRVAQAAVKVVLEPILEADFRPCSYGFRPGRNAHQAVREIEKFLNWKLVRVVDADIRDFFGQIPQDRLMRVIARKVADSQVLRVLRQWLGAGVMEEGQVRMQTTGTPQGGVISPLLANAYLGELDKRWESEGYAARTGWNAHLIRYADDLVVLTDKDAVPPLEALRKSLAEMGLSLHPDKTRLVDADSGSFDFLGFNFRKVWNRGRTKRFALVRPSRKAEQSIRDKVRRLTRYERTDTAEAVVRDLNPVIRGWVNYFRVGHSSATFNKTRDYIVRKVMRYVRRKQLKRGYGWKTLTSDVLYGRWGLFYDYRVLRGAGSPAC